MGTEINLYDRTNIDEIHWPEILESTQAQALLVPMIKEGVEAYIQNVATKLYLIKIGRHILPITVNEKEYDNSYLTSNYVAIKLWEEKLSQKSPRFFHFQKPFIESMGFLLKGMKINKAVIVNNWLLTTSIYPNLTAEEIGDLTHFLKIRFPDHTIFFRNINEKKCAHLVSGLKEHGFRLIGSRFIFTYDPEQKKEFSSKVFYHHRRDRKLIEQEGYQIVRDQMIDEKEVARMLQLYNFIYINKYTKYSPAYTERYIKEAVSKRLFNLIGLKKDGAIQGIMGCFIRNGTMTVPFFGYDAAGSGSNHLYRMMTILAIDEAEKENVLLNDGSGGSAPKWFRGMRPCREYIAVYDRHLLWHRRLFWAAAENVVNKFTFPHAEKQLIKLKSSA